MKKIAVMGVVLLALCFVVSGCKHRHKTDALSEKINSSCTVHFNRTALGGTSSNIVSVRTDNLNGAEISQSGKLLKVTPEWIVLEYYLNNDLKMKRTAWIPRNVILLVSTE